MRQNLYYYRTVSFLLLSSSNTVILCDRPYHKTPSPDTLIFQLCKKHPAKPTTAAIVFKKLFSTQSPFIQEHKTFLIQALQKFKTRKGFATTLTNVFRHAHNPSTAQGFLYELEVASSLEDNGEKVTAFGQHHTSVNSDTSREIDLETAHYWLECKNIQWHFFTQKNKEHLKRQLLDEHLLAEEHTTTSIRPKTFMLCSKQAIPQDWQNWLQEQHIAYIQLEPRENSPC